MKTSLKTAFAQISLAAPKKWGARKFGAAPPSPPLTKLKRISSSSNNYVVLTF